MVTFTELVYWNAFQLFLGQTIFSQPFSVLYTSCNLKYGKKKAQFYRWKKDLQWRLNTSLNPHGLPP